MKKIIYMVFVTAILFSCSQMGKSEKAIQEYMREQTGMPELEIEFVNVQIVKQTVGDSIRMLQEQFEKDTSERTKNIQDLKEKIGEIDEEMKSASKNDMLYQFYSQTKEMLEQQLRKWNEKNIVNGKVRYGSQDPAKVLVTVVQCQMTYPISPILKAKQTKTATFLLTADESKCIRQLK